MNLHIKEAQKEDCDFILRANALIDEASYIASSKLKQNIQKDLFEDKKTVCLIAWDEDQRVGMVLFSKVYWADRGRGVYVSQVFVESSHRKKGIFKKLYKAAFEYYDDTHFLTCLVARKNETMRACMKKCNFEVEDMLSYAINKEQFFK